MFLQCLSKLVPLSIGPLMQPSLEWMMSHSSYHGTFGSLISSIDQGVFCYCRVGIGVPKFSPLHPGLRVFHTIHTAGDGIACLTGHCVNRIVRVLESDQHLPQNVDMLVE